MSTERTGLARHFHQSFASRDACESCMAEIARLRAMGTPDPESAADARPVSPHPPTTEERQAAALERIAAALERIADTSEDDAASASRERAIHLWKMGQGKHPDD